MNSSSSNADGNSASLDDLGPNELREAIALADELQRRESERRSARDAAAELDVAPEYLARALGILLDRRAEREAAIRGRVASVRNIVIGVLAVAAVGAILWPFALFWNPVKLDAVPPNPPFAASAPPAGTSAFGAPITVPPVPIPQVPPVSFRAMSQLLATTITFRNTLERPADIFWLDFFGRPQYLGRLPAGQSVSRKTHVSTPWIALDERRRPIGIFFPQMSPTIAVIRRPTTETVSAQNTGYLKPASVGPVLPATLQAPKGGQGSGANMEFVNMTGKDVEIYAVGPARQAIWVTRLPAYDNYVHETAEAGTLWIVADANRRILESFVEPMGSGTAIITPDVVR